MNKGYALLVLVSSLVSQTMLANAADAEAQIREVIEQFRVSIINKDKSTFSSLFYADDIPFIAVFSDEMLANKRVERPNYPSAVDFGQFGPPAKMLDGEAQEEEKISNIKVQTDGYLASVHFDYSDYTNGKMRAWGSESWSMVKVGSDWKITAVSFTVTEVGNDESPSK